MNKQKQNVVEEVKGNSPRNEVSGGSQGNFPEKKFRAGAISATVWRNKTKEGDGEYNTVVLERCYKDKEDNWQTTNSLRTNDLPKAVVVLQKAYEKIILNEQELFKAEN
jgi:hypothetical protein